MIMVHGQRSDAEALWGEVAVVLQPMGLRRSAAKTRITQIDDGFDFLGWPIQRRTKKGDQAGKRYVCSYPSEVIGLRSRRLTAQLLTRVSVGSVFALTRIVVVGRGHS